MSTLLEDTKFLSSLQQRILANLQEGLPSEHGISREELKRGISLLRSNRRANITEKASSTRKSKSSPPVDLNELINSFEAK